MDIKILLDKYNEKIKELYRGGFGKVSIEGYAESKRSPAIRTKSTFSVMHLLIAYLKLCMLSSLSSGCLQPPR